MVASLQEAQEAITSRDAVITAQDETIATLQGQVEVLDESL